MKDGSFFQMNINIVKMIKNKNISVINYKNIIFIIIIWVCLFVQLIKNLINLITFIKKLGILFINQI
jgi:hypothetical protein